jgi:hypothetical protein
MQNVLIDDRWAETARLFGDTETVIREALKFYSAEKCRQHIRKAEERLSAYNEKYNCNYECFSQAVRTDEKFLSETESQNPLWEEDAAEWEYWHEAYEARQNRLEDILKP